ncbi:MAG: TetR/AcrR family transcriptional regulator [Alphaproteobacteria bacterium]|nr:TetR/AcrR family transcriptional regulator [Alphaproteobacteria bacterium]
MSDSRDVRLRNFVKDKIKETLLKVGRKLVVEKGVEALSARKLATASNSSVGMIYSIFGTMDDYIAAQNVITLSELYIQMKKIVLGKNPFNNLNHYADVLTLYIEENPNLWYLLYSRHLSAEAKKSTISEARIIKKIDILIGMQAARLIKGIVGREKRLVIKVLEMSLFAISGYLLGNKLGLRSGINRSNLCKLLMNTYLAGLASIKETR